MTGVCECGTETTDRPIDRPAGGARARRLAGLLGPGEVVVARLGARHALDVTLEERPEADRLERVVEPAGRDAEERLVRRHVVDAVVTPRQNDMQVLQQRDVARQAEVRVRPLVKLQQQASQLQQNKPT